MTMIIDGALELAKAETSALLHTAKRLVRHLEEAESAVDREGYALAMLQADIHATVLAEEVEDTRKLASRCGIEIGLDSLAIGDDDGDVEEEDTPLEEEDEEDLEEGFELPEERDSMLLRRAQ